VISNTTVPTFAITYSRLKQERVDDCHIWDPVLVEQSTRVCSSILPDATYAAVTKRVKM
jgi:hypothetical protein